MMRLPSLPLKMIFSPNQSQPHKQICSHSSSSILNQPSNHNSINLRRNLSLHHPNKNSLLSLLPNNMSNKMISSVSNNRQIRNLMSNLQHTSLQLSLVPSTWWVWSTRQHRCQSSNQITNNTTTSSQHLASKKAVLSNKNKLIFLRCLRVQVKYISNLQHLRRLANSLIICLNEFKNLFKIKLFISNTRSNTHLSLFDNFVLNWQWPLTSDQFNYLLITVSVIQIWFEAWINSLLSFNWQLLSRSHVIFNLILKSHLVPIDQYRLLNRL